MRNTPDNYILTEVIDPDFFFDVLDFNGINEIDWDNSTGLEQHQYIQQYENFLQEEKEDIELEDYMLNF